MYGVVLWSDTAEKKAVIWCEDQGDLAFYRHSEVEGNLLLDAGDYVQFELSMDRHFRYAHNPRVVGEGAYVGLAESLRTTPEPAPRSAAESAEIIPLDVLRARAKQGGTDVPIQEAG